MTAPAQVPPLVADYSRQLAQLIETRCPGQLVGAYLHGSAALGGWEPTRSDVDLVIVLDTLPTRTALAAVEQVLVDRGPSSPGTGLECSVVTAEAAATPCDPWPFLLHVQAFRDQEATRVPGDLLPGDRDLLMHYAVCRAAGVRLCGPDARDIFGPVPRSVVLPYLVDELRWGMGHTSAAYAVLNACRALTFMSRGELVSKIEGGQLAVEEGLGPVEVITRALAEQRGLAEPGPLTLEATAFVDRVVTTLDSEARLAEG